MTASDTVALLRETLARYLGQSFESGDQRAEGDLVIWRSGAAIHLRPAERINSRTTIDIWSITNLGVSVDGDLARFLAIASGELAFGGFSLDPERSAVLVRHTLLGDFVGRNEVMEVVEAIGSSAQVYGARIRAMFGGRLFSQQDQPIPDSTSLAEGTTARAALPEPAPVAELGQRLERFAGELFEDWCVDDEGDFSIGGPGAGVWIRPVELPGGRSGLRIWSITNMDVRVDDGLARFIVTENAGMTFATLYLEQGRPSVAVGHTLPSTFNRTELELAVEAVASAAKEYGSRIKKRFGGKLFDEIR